MKKQIAAAMILVVFILCSCLPSELASTTCKLIENNTKFRIDIHYTDEQTVDSLKAIYTITFDEKVVSDMSEREIKSILQSVFEEKGNESIQMKVTYNNKQRIGEIQWDAKLDSFSESELETYHLKKEMKLDELMNGLIAEGFDCEVIE